MYAKDLIKKVENNKKKDISLILDDTAKGTIIGACIGAGIGAYIGYIRKNNLLLSAFIGSIIGGGISRVFIKKK